jgi:predicted nucleotidyltransferase
MPTEQEKERYVTEADDRDTWRRIADEAMRVLESASIPYAATGSIAITAFGDERSGDDVDLLLKRDDADRALDALTGAGFETERAEPDWLYKAVKERVLVDLIFNVGRTLEPDDEMLRRARRVEVKGLQLPLVTVEDFIISQAVANKRDAPTYWYHGLTALAHGVEDWDYVIRRAEKEPHRVLSLLIYGESEGLSVPEVAARRLFDMTHARPAAAHGTR